MSSYHNPLIQTNALAKSFQKKKPCGKCGRIHNHGDCPAHGQTCHSCGKKNHWTQMCRTRRSSSTGCTLSPHHQQNRQRWPSNRQHKQHGGGGKGSDKFFKKGTPNKKRSQPKNKNIASLEVVMGGNSVSNCDGLSGPSHHPKEKYPLSGPPHPPKEKYSHQTDTGEACSNPFTCYALGNGNEGCMIIVIRNTRSILTRTVMARQRSSLISIVTRKPGGFMQSCFFLVLSYLQCFLVYLLQYLKDTINIIPQTTTRYEVLCENRVTQI